MTGDTGTTISPPVPLTGNHNLIDFDCGAPALNDWLRHRALRNEGRFSRTFAICDGNVVVGYYSLSAGAVERADAPGTLRRNAPETMPVAVLGRLAVSRSHAGRGLGSDLLSDALRRIAEAAHIIGIAAILVHAKDDGARRFYLGCAEFLEYPLDSRVLFLPVQTLLAAAG